MMKKILGYGLTLAVTIGVFSTLLTTETTNQAFANGKEKSAESRYFENEQNEHEYSKTHDRGVVPQHTEQTLQTQQQAIDAVLAERGGNITKVEYEQRHGETMLEIKGIDGQGKRYEVYVKTQ